MPSKVLLDKRQIIERLSNEINHTLRNCLEEKQKKEEIYKLFKTILRLMLVNKDVSKKEELLNSFKEEYFKINLPKNAKNILNKKIIKSDLEDVLKFSEDCLRYLVK